MSESVRRDPRSSISSETRKKAFERQAVSPPDLIVVAQRPSQGSAVLLPPILILMLCLGFLVIRSSTREWRGIGPAISTAWTKFTTRPKEAPKPAAAVAPKVETTPAPVLLADAGQTEVNEPTVDEAQPKVAAKPEDSAAWDDIRREAEAKKLKLAELERLKEEQSQKLADTEAERKLADGDRQGRRRRGPGPNPQQVEQMMQAQRQAFEEHVARMIEFQRRQMGAFGDMQQRFGFPGGPQDGGLPPTFRFNPPNGRRQGRGKSRNLPQDKNQAPAPPAPGVVGGAQKLPSFDEMLNDLNARSGQR